MRMVACAVAAGLTGFVAGAALMLMACAAFVLQPDDDESDE